jgi:formylglycine-generating enzyme required for sulfatase activity
MYMGVYEVMQEEYLQIVGVNPSHFALTGRGARQVAPLDTDRLPVESVSWNDAVEFCRRLSTVPDERRTGGGYRLPSEAEWEYACRAGTSSAYCVGDLLTKDDANIDPRKDPEPDVAVSALGRSTEVGSYRPNAFGMHDMHGNVYEWCNDLYQFGFYTESAHIDPVGPVSGASRVIRGGGWTSPAYHLRSANRGDAYQDSRNSNMGFRVACEIDD